MHRRRIVSAIVLGVLALSALVLGGWQARAHSNVAPSAAPHYLPPGGEVGKGEQFATMDTYWNDRLTYPTGHFNPAWLRAAKRQDARIASRRPQSPNLATWTPLGPQPERMTGCTGCYDYGKTEGRVNVMVIDPTTTTQGSIVAYAGTVGGGVWKTTNCCSGSTSWTSTTDDPLISTDRHRHAHDRPERPQHDLCRHGRPELRLVLDGQPGDPQVDGRRRALDDARRRRLRARLHGARRPVPAVRRRRQGARRPEQQPTGRRRHEEGDLRLLQRRDELDRPVLDEHLPDSAPGHHRPGALGHGRRKHADRRCCRRPRLRDDRAVRPRQQRRERPLHANMPASGCPTFTSIASNAQRLRLRQRGHRQPVHDRRCDERRLERRRSIRQRATSSAESTSPSRRATRR